MLIGHLSGFVRVDANARVDPIILLGKRQGRIEFLGARPGADGEQHADPRGTRPIEHGIAVFVKLRKVYVRVGVYEFHHRLRPIYAASRTARYFSREPTGTSSRKPARIGFPSGPAAAATIMPLDSTPRSFLGARFTTTATLRPTSFSGSWAVAIPATICRTSSPMSTVSFSSLSAP